MPEMNVKAAHKKYPRALKMAIRALPLIGVVASVFLHLSAVGQQFMVLIVLIWVQVYFVLELFLAGK
jgi:hypothetical protein